MRLLCESGDRRERWIATTGGERLELRVPRGRLGRALGLIGATALASGEGLLIPRCRSVHTFGMRYAIDVVFVAWPAAYDDAGVLAVFHVLVPRRVASVRGPAAALELAAGEAARLGIESGTELPLQKLAY